MSMVLHSWNTITTIFYELVRSPTLSNRTGRVSRDSCSLDISGGASRPLSPYKTPASFFTSLPNPSGPASYLDNTVSQWRMTTSTTIFNMVCDSRSPCVTPLYPLNGTQYYRLALDTMVRTYQYLQKRHYVFSPTTYATRISIQHSQSDTS